MGVRDLGVMSYGYLRARSKRGKSATYPCFSPHRSIVWWHRTFKIEKIWEILHKFQIICIYGSLKEILKVFFPHLSASNLNKKATFLYTYKWQKSKGWTKKDCWTKSMACCLVSVRCQVTMVTTPEPVLTHLDHKEQWNFLIQSTKSILEITIYMY